MDSGYPSDWDSRRRSVYKRDGYTCQNCGAQGGPYGNTELNAHHIVPKSKGGTHSTSNLVTICRPCHDAIHYDQQAPTQYSTKDVTELLKNNHEELSEFLREFGEICMDVDDFIREIDGDLFIRSDGKIDDDALEGKRVELIQRLGALDIYLESFRGKHPVIDDIENYRDTLISVFTTFETVGEIIEDDTMPDAEKRGIIETKLRKKFQEENKQRARTKQSIDEYRQQVNNARETVEAEQKSSSFISRLFNF